MSEFVQIEIQLSRSSTVTCAPTGRSTAVISLKSAPTNQELCFRKHNVRVCPDRDPAFKVQYRDLRTDGPLYCGVLAPGNHPHMDVGRVRPVTLCGSGGT